MKAILYVIGELTIGLMCISAIWYIFKGILKLLCEFSFANLAICIPLLFIASAISYRLWKYIENNF